MRGSYSTYMTESLLPNYDQLTPDLVISAVESLGYLSDARVFPLNSYENRVYQVGIDEETPVIAKFYRPLRWSDDQILEEHRFSEMLYRLELPVIAPIAALNDETLHRFGGYRFSLFKRQGGQAPEPGDFDQLHWLGRLIGRIHQAGKAEAFTYRPKIDIQSYCTQPAQDLIEHEFIPTYQRDQFQSIIRELTTHCTELFESTDKLTFIRSHSDCHVGNILWNRDTGPWFVDFDDCRMAPAMQDLWMLLAGDRPSQVAQLSEILDGYEEFCEFNYSEIQLIEALRSLRMIHYAGWLAMRWNDPAFPRAFPWFNTANYWPQLLAELQEQVLVMREEPLRLF